MDRDMSDIEGQCHCGSVRFRAKLTDGLNTARRCNCSMCRMRGAIAVSAPIADFTLLQGADSLTLYQFNTKVAEHYFCSVCGIYTHHKRRSKPNEYGINVACIAGLSPFDFEEVTVLEGALHPADRNGAPVSPIAGHLRYSPFKADQVS